MILDEKFDVCQRAKQAVEFQIASTQALRSAYLREVFPSAGEKLPEGWKWVRLKDICFPDNRIVVQNSEESKKLPFIGLENIESNSGRLLINEDGTLLGYGISTSYYFDTKHVLYGKLRPYLNKVALPSFTGRCSTELIPLLPKDISREYLALILRQQSIVNAVMKEKTGTRMPRASIEVLLDQLVPFPPKEAQEKILKQVTNKIDICFHIEQNEKAQLETVSKLPQAYLRQAFKGEL